MARYFFNEINGEYKKDDEGVELPSLDAARVLAIQYVSEVLRDHPSIVWGGEDFRVEVTDRTQLLMVTVIVVGIDAPAGAKSTNPALKRP